MFTVKCRHRARCINGLTSVNITKQTKHKEVKMKRIIIAAAVAAVLTGCGQKTPNEYLDGGNELLASGDTKSALIEYKNALQQDKGFLPARLALAEVYVESRKFEDAEKELGVLLKVTVNDLKVHGIDREYVNKLLARTYHGSQSSAQLMSTFNSDTSDVEILYYLFHEHVIAQEIDEADAIFNKVKSMSGSPTLFRNLIEAENAYRSGDRELALKLLNTHMMPTSHPVFGPWMLLKSDIALSMRDTDGAIEALSAYTKAIPTDATRLFQLSNIRVRSGHGEDAKEDIANLLKRAPQNALLNELDAIIRYDEKDYEGALSATQVALAQSPSSVMPRLIGAFSAEQLGQSELALSNLDFIIDKLPPSHPAQRLYIKLKAEQGQLDGLGEQALSIENLTSDDVGLLSSVGLGLMQSGDVEAAEKLAAKAKELDANENKTPALGLLQLALNDESGLETLEGAFEQSPDDWTVNSSLATAYLAKGKLDDALVLSSEWIASGKTIEGHMLAGVVNARKGELTLALTNLEKVLAEAPDHFMAQAASIETWVASGQIDKAKDAVVTWAQEVNDSGLYRNFISSMRGVDKLEEAVRFVEKDVKSKSVLNDDAGTRLLVAQASVLIPDAQLAIDLLKNHSAPAGGEAAYWLVLSTSYNMLGDKKSAVDSYQRWLDDQPDNPMALMGVVRALAENNDTDAVLETLDKYAPNHENKAPIDMLRVNFLVDKRDWSKARAIFSRLPSEIKAAPTAQGLGGVLDLERGNTKSGVEQLEKAYSAIPNDRHVRWLSAGYQQAGKIDKQIELLERHVESQPASHVAWFLLGNAALSVSDFSKGEKAYLSALDLLPENPLLLNNLAYAQIELAKYNDAIKHAEKALEIAPGQPEMVDTLAVALLRSGDATKALAVVSDTYAKHSDKLSDAFMATYIEALVKNNHVDKAKVVYKTHNWKDAKKKHSAETFIK